MDLSIHKTDNRKSVKSDLNNHFGFGNISIMPCFERN